MNTLLATLLDCPNLSLRVLDINGRVIKTLNQEQLRRQVESTLQPGLQQPCLQNSPGSF